MPSNKQTNTRRQFRGTDFMLSSLCALSLLLSFSSTQTHTRNDFAYDNSVFSPNSEYMTKTKANIQRY